jgi:hypothetical protein
MNQAGELMTMEELATYLKSESDDEGSKGAAAALTENSIARAERRKDRIVRAVLTIALVAATALLVLSVVAIIGFAVQQQFQGRRCKTARPRPATC